MGLKNQVFMMNLNMQVTGGCQKTLKEKYQGH